MADASQPLRRTRRWLLALVIGLVTTAAGLSGLLVGVYALTLVPELPKLRDVQAPEIAVGSVAYTADGAVLARYFYENRVWVEHRQIARPVIDALIATEDHRFYGHAGVDVRRFFSSAARTAGGDRQGGSTLTMQLARNVYPGIGRAPALERKLKEVMTAVKIERHYSKDEIVEMYLNTVPFGYNAFGIEAAAQTYFQKPASQLGTAEAALLVGMLKGPSRYNPVRHPERARQRRNVVLAQMARRGALSSAEATRLQRQPLGLDFQLPQRADGLAPHFAEYVRQWAADWAERYGYDLYRDGLRIYTTLDSRLQAHAAAAARAQMDALQAVAGVEWSRSGLTWLGEDAAAYGQHQSRVAPFGYLWRTRTDLVDDHVRRTRRFRQQVDAGASAAEALAALRQDAVFMDSLRQAVTRLEVGLVALDPNSGHVKAWVGGRDFRLDQYDHVGLAKRQPGSTFKPFVYATAVDFGFSPYHRLPDRPPELEDRGRAWRLTNAGGGYSGALVTLRDGLAYSKNTVAAQLMAELGPFQIARTAHNLGIRSRLDHVPSLALGTSEVTLLELTGAYATLASGGVRRPPVVVTRIEDAEGRLVAAFAPEAEKAVSMYTAYTVLDMMRGVVDRGTATRIRWQHGIEEDVAGKTGTTQNSADGWFLLMHPRLVMGAWVGFNDRRIAFRSDFWGQGGHNALHVVGDFFGRALADDALKLAGARFLPPPGYRAPRPEDVAALYAHEDEAAAEPLLLELDAARSTTAPEPDAEHTLRRGVQAGFDEVREDRGDAEAGGSGRDTLRPALQPLPPALPAPKSAEPLVPERNAEEALRKAVKGQDL